MKKNKEEKRRKKEEKKIKKEAKKAMKSKNKEDKFLLFYDNNSNCFVFESDLPKVYFDILHINSLDVNSAYGTPTYVNELLSFEDFYEKYRNDIKIVAMNFPTDLSVQKKYVQDRYLKENNPRIKEGLNEKYYEFNFVEKRSGERNYFLFLYGNSFEEIVMRRSEVVGRFNINGTMNFIDKGKKIELLRKMNNPADLLV